MPHLIGPFHIRGTLGDLNYYRTQKGQCIIRQRRQSTKNAFYRHPRYERCRENVAEFVLTSKHASRISRAFSSRRKYFSDSEHFNRLVGLLRMIAQTSTSERGSRCWNEGNIHLLEGFSFNKDRSFSNTINAESSVTIDTDTGHCHLLLADFVPALDLHPPARAAYFQIIFRVAVLGEDGKDYEFEDLTGLHATNSAAPLAISLQTPFLSTPGALILVGAGILFYEDYMGIPVPIRGGTFEILEVQRHLTPGQKPTSPDKSAEAEAFHKRMEAIAHSFYPELPGIVYTGNKNLAPPGYQEQLLRVRRQIWLNKLQKYRTG